MHFWCPDGPFDTNRNVSNGLQIGPKLLPTSVLELHTQTRKPAEEEEEEEEESGLDAQSARFGAYETHKQERQQP